MTAEEVAQKSWSLWNDYYKDGDKSSSEILLELKTCIEEYAKLAVSKQWISVEERLPEDDAVVFCYTNVGGKCTCFYKNGVWRYLYNSGIIDPALYPTHWMPLPEPPIK